MGFVRVIKDIFQQSMNGPVTRTLIARTGIESIKRVLELSFEGINQIKFGVYDKISPILIGKGADWMVIRLLKSFHFSCKNKDHL